MNRERHAIPARTVIAKAYLSQDRPNPREVAFIIPGNPIPWARQRIARNGHHFTDARTKRAKETVAAHALNEMSRGGRQPLTGPVKVTLLFFRETRQRCDLDRLCSLPLDAMNEIVYDDDLQVVELKARKEVDKEYPRTEIVVEEML